MHWALVSLSSVSLAHVAPRPPFSRSFHVFVDVCVGVETGRTSPVGGLSGYEKAAGAWTLCAGGGGGSGAWVARCERALSQHPRPPPPAAFLFFDFCLSVMACLFAVRAVDELREKKRDEARPQGRSPGLAAAPCTAGAPLRRPATDLALTAAARPCR